jgi:predicted DCC family thiol-disulfide oxidoreductase YuxK
MSLTRRMYRFLGERVPSRPLAIARIGVALAVILELPNSGKALLRLDDPGIIRVPMLPWTPAVTDSLALVLIGLWAASAFAVLVGWRTRLAATALTLTLAIDLLLDQQLFENHIYLMVLLAALLAVANSGAALSLDARRPGEQAEVSRWPVWLIQFQISVVYGFAALSKINLAFLSGSPVATSLRRVGPLAVPDAWRSPEPMLVLALMAICAEGFLAVALWSPRWRPTAFVVALALHGGLAVWFAPTYQLIVFAMAMLPPLILFLDAAPGRVVVWDDGCGFCATWVAWFRRLDWLKALRFVKRSELAASGLPITEEAAARALQLVSPKGAVYGGFAAVGRVLEVLPISFLWAPLLRLPPIAWVGELGYRRVALRRKCELPVAAQSAAVSHSH